MGWVNGRIKLKRDEDTGGGTESNGFYLSGCFFTY